MITSKPVRTNRRNYASTGYRAGVARDLSNAQNARIREACTRLLANDERFRGHGGLTRLAAAIGVRQPTLSAFINEPHRGMRYVNALVVAELAGRPLPEVMGPRGDESETPASQSLRLDPEADARRWFLHRVEHEGLGTEAEALAWLEQHKEPFTRPVPWNNQAFLAYRRHVEGGAAHAPAVRAQTSTGSDQVAEVLARPVPSQILAGGRVMFLQYIAKTDPDRLDEAEEHLGLYKAAHKAKSRDDVFADIKAMWEALRRGGSK